jgi:hypothetical protein
MHIERLDLHGYSVADAIECFVRKYNWLVSQSSGDEQQALEVVHGKGKGEGSGLIKEAVRDFLRLEGTRIKGFDAQLVMRGASYAAQNDKKLSYMHGEDVSGNSGCTIVIPRQRLSIPRDWAKYRY